MGASLDGIKTDKLGRRSGPRRKYTVAEKRSMVEETQQPGASVPEIAQRHAVNANLLSVWRRLYRQGLLIEQEHTRLPALLPVDVSTPTMLPTRRVSAAKAADRDSSSALEVEFSNGQRLRIRGTVDRLALREIIVVLSRR